MPSLFQLLVRKRRETKDCELVSKAKVDVEDDEIDIDDEEGSDDESVVSTVSDKPKTLIKQLKKSSPKYPTKCSTSEAHLFFPTSHETVHDTGVPGKYIGSRENLPQYKGLYCCMFEGCDYGAQVRASTLSHIRRVHLRHAIGCRYCPAKGWWQARYWLNHMDSCHADLPKYETIELPPNVEAVKVEPDVFITQEQFEVPVPKSMEPLEPPSKNKKSEKLLSYQEFMKESAKEGEIYVPAEPRISTQPRPQAAAIRYRHTYSIASQEEADSIMEEGEGEEFVSTDTYNIEC